MGTDLYDKILLEGIEQQSRSILETQLSARFGKRVSSALKKLGTLRVKLIPYPTTNLATIRDDEAFEQIEALNEDRTKREIRASLVGTAKLKFGEINWMKHIGGKAALMGTDIFEEIIQEGVEKGAENERIAILEDQLRTRFGKRVESSVRKLGMLDGKTLRELATKFAAIRDDEDFLKELRRVLSKR